MEALFGFLVFVSVMVIAGIVFALWLAWTVAGTVWRALAPPSVQAVLKARPAPAVVCPRGECSTANPAVAKYCRRCGRPLGPGAMRVVHAA